MAACGGGPDTAGKNIDEQPEDRVPVVFIPGIQGSVLVAAADSRVLWPPGGLEADLGITTIKSARNDFFRLSLNPATKHETIYPADVIRHWGSTQFYEQFLNYLKDTGGYVEYDVSGKPERRTASGAFTAQKPKPSLFVFAYDWRLGIEENARILSDYVEVAAAFYPGKKVNIVTHSMGGLVARRYIIDHRDRVNKLITVAAPFLGSAKPLYQMIYAKLSAPVSYGPTVAWETFQETLVGTTTNPFAEGPIEGMLNYFPGVHELMSSEAYFTLGGPPYTRVETLTEAAMNLASPQEKALSFEQLMGPNGKVDELFPNPAKMGDVMKSPAKANRDFHAYTSNGNAQDDWSRDSTGVKYYHLIGVQGSRDTPLSLREATGYTAAQVRDYALNIYGPGDGTVPLLSAARMGNGKNLNAPDARLFVYAVGGAGAYPDYPDILNNKAVSVYPETDDKLVEHTGIMTNSGVWRKALELLAEKDAQPTLTPKPTGTITPTRAPSPTPPASPTASPTPASTPTIRPTAIMTSTPARTPTPSPAPSTKPAPLKWVLSDVRPNPKNAPLELPPRTGPEALSYTVTENTMAVRSRVTDQVDQTFTFTIKPPPLELYSGQPVNFTITGKAAGFVKPGAIGRGSVYAEAAATAGSTRMVSGGTDGSMRLFIGGGSNRFPSEGSMVVEYRPPTTAAGNQTITIFAWLGSSPGDAPLIQWIYTLK